MKAPDILTMAANHMAARASTYDQPDGERSMDRAVRALNTILNRPALSESEGWLFMQVLKDVRDRTSPAPHADSLEDCVAYAALKAEARLAEAGKLPAEEAAIVDWSQAPEWAQWVAQDQSGGVWWHEVAPLPPEDDGVWGNRRGSKCQEATPNMLGGCTSLERP